MKKDKTKLMRTGVQASIILILVIIITLYNLYTREILDFKILGIGDMNPYGGWNALREFITDSSYEFEGISADYCNISYGCIGRQVFLRLDVPYRCTARLHRLVWQQNESTKV